MAGHDPHRDARDTHGDPAVQPVAADSGTAPVAHDPAADGIAAVGIATATVAVSAVGLPVTPVSVPVIRIAVALRVPESVHLGQPEPVAFRRHAGWIGIAQCSRSPDDQLPAVAACARNWADESGPTCYSSLYDAVAGDLAEGSTALGADLAR